MDESEDERLRIFGIAVIFLALWSVEKIHKLFSKDIWKRARESGQKNNNTSLIDWPKRVTTSPSVGKLDECVHAPR